MVLFAALTLALSTVMGVLPGLVLVTVKPALPVRAAGFRLLGSVSLSTSWVPLTLGAASPVVISAGGVVSGVSLFTDWSVKLAASLPAASCTTLPVAGLV